MKSHSQRYVRGFTLVELAIVMGIAGILLAGLWRLIAASNGQVRDQAAASQQTQLIAAIGQYLQSTDGQTVMTAPATTGNILLPTVNTSTANCINNITVTLGGTTSQAAICNYLPPGFTSTTVNSYGQTYAAQFLKDSSGAGHAPQSYTFMILTTGGDTITDTSGGRISGFIGADGGFVYSQNVCGTPANTFACGAYGAWSATPIATYGFAASTSGHIASRTYYSPLTGSSDFWLARNVYPNDPPFYVYNTMTTDLYMKAGTSIHMHQITGPVTHGGGGVFEMESGTLYMSYAGTTGSGGTINLQSGTLNVQGGTVDLSSGEVVAPRSNYLSPAITITAAGPTFNAANSATQLLNVAANCSLDSGVTGAPLDATCKTALSVGGDAGVSGRLSVNSLYSQTFIYDSSDRRLKKDIVTLEDPLGHVMRMRPVSYTLKSSGTKGLGVVAQEMQDIYPQLISHDEHDMLGVNYMGLVSPLIGAVQQLKKDNDDLRQQLDKQGAQIERLQKMIEKDHPQQ